ncbi:MAG: hypothetical protein COZ69_12105 [Deltaproteobacteria bacterium CG_4_8_14_3_um_filter_45_9]|nr:MAG: hypothetical protein COS40_08780 [Deltaproteobacteria bacterium CG03_land_8_20_14_0_80_45_14]PIX22037.1 MAG: hypothetical protein COZ69_12105 [Deltaproteobacteria bacterium CG_4_8_14_3_um_filter_45_9]
MKRVFPLIAFFSLLFLFLTSVAFGQAQTRLRVIRASNVGQSIDPPLKELHNELKTLFNFTSYRLLRDENLSLSLNQPVSISAREGRIIMEIILVGLHKNVAELRIRVNREGTEILNTQVRLSPGRTVLIGGPKLREGVIIYALSARF